MKKKFLSSWLREEEKEKEEIMLETGEETNEERGKKRGGEEDKEENETERVKRRFVSFVSVEAFDVFGQGEDLESCGDLFGEDLFGGAWGPV